MPGSKQCSSCRKVFYCCKEHQKLDWKGSHKAECSRPDFDPLDSESQTSTFHLNEFELITEEAEEEDHAPDSEEEEDAEQENDKELEKLNRMTIDGQAGTMSARDVQEALAGAEAKADEAMAKFKEVTAHSPKQVLRYSRRGTPLWISSEKRLLPGAVPNCESCGGPRVFEFQLMPQLLACLNLDSSIDWGILAVYTCEDSCSSSDPNDKEYKSEYIFRQMPSSRSDL